MNGRAAKKCDAKILHPNAGRFASGNDYLRESTEQRRKQID
jgi:hypothetical protein